VTRKDVDSLKIFACILNFFTVRPIYSMLAVLRQDRCAFMNPWGLSWGHSSDELLVNVANLFSDEMEK
jgi:hypothetical protein